MVIITVIVTAFVDHDATFIALKILRARISYLNIQ